MVIGVGAGGVTICDNPQQYVTIMLAVIADNDDDVKLRW